jgi:hypothetical protein
MNTLCEHVKNHRCSIHGSHPETCRVFTCAWLGGDLPERYRPDECGIILWEARERAIQASLTRADVPLERVEYLLSKLPTNRRNVKVNGKVTSQPRPVLVIPVTLKLSSDPEAEKGVRYRQVRPGISIAEMD